MDCFTRQFKRYGTRLDAARGAFRKRVALRNVDDLAGLYTFIQHARVLRPAAHDLGVRRPRPQIAADAADQPASTGCDEYRIDAARPGAEVRRQLFPVPPLPANRCRARCRCGSTPRRRRGQRVRPPADSRLPRRIRAPYDAIFFHLASGTCDERKISASTPRKLAAAATPVRGFQWTMSPRHGLLIRKTG